MDIRTFFIILLSLLLAGSLAVLGLLYSKGVFRGDVILYPGPPPGADAGINEATPGMAYAQLFFLSQDQSQLQIEKRAIAQAGSTKDRVQAALSELLKGPNSNQLASAIPEGTELLNVFWSQDERCMYVSFSGDLLRNHPGHALSEWATIFSIVNTAASQSPSIQQVQILLDGQAITDGMVLWDWSAPFEPDMTFVRRDASVSEQSS